MKKNKFLIIVLIMLLCLVSCKPKNPDNGNEIPDKPNPGITDKPTRPHEHKYSEWVIETPASLFNKGKRTCACSTCDSVLEEDLYYFDEVTFESKTYQYSGEQKKLLISGLLPRGIRVEYKNNVLTNIGSVEATANYINENNEIVKTDTAILSVVDYTGFPRIDIDTSGQPILNKETYVASKISVSNCNDEYKLSNILAGVRLRGNGTLQAEKKPYRIKFDKKQVMLGLNDNLAAKSWVLLAEYYDYSMLRNSAAFILGESLLDNAGYYTSSFQHVNLYINGIYNGVYVLAEQQQVNSDRVDIYEPESDELQTNIGYLLELDSYAASEGDFFNLNTNGLNVKDANGNNVSLQSMSYSIKSDYFSDNQKQFIGKYVNNVFMIMYKAIFEKEYLTFDTDYNLVNSTFTNVYDTINNVINIDSLVRMYILQEIMKNVDVGFSSFYLYVDFSEDSKYPKLTFGAPWDFDWSSGNINNASCYSSTGNYVNTTGAHVNPWLITISNADFFKDLLVDYYELFINSGVFENLIYQLDEITSTYELEFSKNFGKWNTLGTQLHVYATADVLRFKTQSDAAEFLKNWLIKRDEYLKTIWK